MKKYELTENTIVRDGVTLYQVRYLKAFKKDRIKVGDLGGYVESEENFSQEGTCLILDEGVAMGNSKVTMDASIRQRGMIRGHVVLAGKALVLHDSLVSDQAVITGNTRMCQRAKVTGTVIIRDDVQLMGDCHITGNTVLAGSVWVKDNAYISMNKLPDTSIHPAHIYESVKVFGDAQITGDAILFGIVEVCEKAEISGSPVISGITTIMGTAGIGEQATITGTVEVSGNSLVKGKATLAGTIVFKDSLIEGIATVTGACSITGRCFIYDKAVIADSIMMNGAQLHQSAELRSSKLDGDITAYNNAKIISSQLAGQEVSLKGYVKLYKVEMKNGMNVKIMDKSTLHYLLLEKCENVRIYDDAMLDGDSDEGRIVITGKTITLADNAEIGSSVVILGTNVDIRGHASVKGKVVIGNDVFLTELASIENEDPSTPYALNHEVIGMDTNIFIS